MASNNASRFSYINMFHIRLLFNLLFDVSGFFCSRIAQSYKIKQLQLETVNGHTAINEQGLTCHIISRIRSEKYSGSYQLLKLTHAP